MFLLGHSSLLFSLVCDFSNGCFLFLSSPCHLYRRADLVQCLNLSGVISCRFLWYLDRFLYPLLKFCQEFTIHFQFFQKLSWCLINFLRYQLHFRNLLYLKFHLAQFSSLRDFTDIFLLESTATFSSAFAFVKRNLEFPGIEMDSVDFPILLEYLLLLSNWNLGFL